MERNREGRRAAAMAGSAAQSVTRRPRVKDASDDEDRLEDTIVGESRAWERSKKERLATFHVSAPMNPRNKRKRQAVPHESHGPGGRLSTTVDDADESLEETEPAASEDDDEPPPPPLLRRPGKARVPAKEDEIVMDIPAVPRKARSSISSSSRFSSISRRQPEPQPADLPRQKSPAMTQTSLNGNSSPNFLQKQGRKLKPVGPKVRAAKVPKVSEPSTMSDQEAEVAEALFVLARSMPSHTGLLETKVEVKLEAEARTGSPPANPTSSLAVSSLPSSAGLHHAGSTTNGYVSSHLKEVTGPVAEAPKRKRPRVVIKQEDGRVPTPVRLVSSGAVSSSTSPSVPVLSSVGAEMDLDSQHEKAKASADVHGSSSDLSKVKAIVEATEEKKTGLPEDDGSEQGEFKAPKLEKQSVSEMGEVQSDRLVQGVAVTDVVAGDDGPLKGGLCSRPADGLRDDDGSVSKLNIDLMASPVKISSMEEEVPGSSIEKQAVGDNPSAHLEEQLKRSAVLEDAVRTMDAARVVFNPKERVDVENLELKDDVGQQHLIKEQVALQSGRGIKEGEREREVDSPKVLPRPQKEEIESPVVMPPFVSTTLPTAASSSAPVPLAGWMGGLPQLGYYGPGAASWAAGAALPNPGLDVKAAHPAMQLQPPNILSPVPRMKRCACHVYMAHFIYRDQQLSRHSLWSAALCRSAPYNLNIPPVNMLDNEKLSGHYMDAARKASTPQSGSSYGYTISQGGGPAMGAGSGSALNTGASGTMPTPNHSNGAAITADAGTTSGSGTTSGNVMAAHAQYLQAMIQQNGFPSFPFPFNGPPGQAAQFFNSPFFPPHLMPPLPHLQPLPQQAGNVLPVPKQQAGLSSLGHSNSAQLVAPSLQQQQQQQLQLQLAPQSPSQSQQQQHNHVGISPQFGLHSDKESLVGNESQSTAESRLNAMQRSMSAQGPSNLPNLNISPSSLMLSNNLPAMSSHESEGAPLVGSGGKQALKSQQSFQAQSPASLSASMQPQQFTASSGPGHQGYPAIANRGPVGPGPLGLVSVSSMMGTPAHGVLSGSTESSKGHAQQPQNYVGHSQHFQRAINKAPSASEDAYAAKGRDYTDDKKMSMKQGGGPPLLSRADMEVSSPSLQGSPTSGSGVSSAVRMSSGVGRTLSSVTPPENRSSRPASSAGSVQAPLLQNQPQKQAAGRAKSVSGTNVASAPSGHSVAAYSERVMPGNLGKFPGTVLPFSGQMSQTTQSSKPNQAGVVKMSQRMTPAPAQQQMPASAMPKTQVQQARSSQLGVPSTPPRMLPSVPPVLTAGTLSMPTSHSLSVAKAAVVGSSKSPSNGKGSVSATKSGPPASKKPPVSGPVTSSVVSPGQNMSVRAPVLQKSQAGAAHVPQFSQQQSSIASQQQRLGTKNQVYQQLQPQQGQYKQPFPAQSPYRPQLFLQQHQQQYMQQPSSQPMPQQQQQAIPQHTQLPASHHYQASMQNLPVQHGQTPQLARTDSSLSHIQQQFQPVSSSQPSAANNNLTLSSPNLTLGTAVSGNMSSTASSDGADQFKGAISRTNPPKSVYAPGNPLPSGGMPEIITTALPAVSSQVSSPHSGSSHYLQLAPVKPPEQKPSPDVAAGRDDMNIARHLASPSSSQVVAGSNPSSS